MSEGLGAYDLGPFVFVKRKYNSKGDSSLADHTRGFTNVIQRDEA